MRAVSVQCREIRLAYGSTEVLKDVSLDIAAGEFFALLGASGSGKSSLLRLIAGFNRHQHGQLLVDGVDITGQAPWQRRIGMVFQSYALWPHLSVWDNVAFGLVELRQGKAVIAAKVGAALELVGLSGLGPRRPNQLSGGQQQRVALARTIVVEPQVLLLDEPLSNLDKTLRAQMRLELLALQRRLGITTIFVTHDQEEAMSTADRMAVLDHGVVQQCGTPEELYDRPVNRFVAGFVGTMNLLEGRVVRRRGDSVAVEIEGIGVLDLAAHPGMRQAASVIASVRPHALRIAAPGAVRDASCLWVAGQLQMREFLGAYTRCWVQVGPHRLAVDQPHRGDAPRFAPGDAVTLELEPAQMRVLGS